MIADMFDAFFLDLDGVVYVGEKPTSRAVEVLSRLRDMGKDIRFLTNNPTPREFIVRRLNRMGIYSSEYEVITSGTVTASALVAQGIKTAWVLGDSLLKDVIESEGVELEQNSSCEAVVVGWDGTITLDEVRKAALAIREGASFVATNEDYTFPRPEGQVSGVGVLVEALRAGSGKIPLVIGKPEKPMFEEGLRSIGEGKRAVMIGDTPESDIIGAHKAGMEAILMGDARHSSILGDLPTPNGQIDSLEDLFGPRSLFAFEGIVKTDTV